MRLHACDRPHTGVCAHVVIGERNDIAVLECLSHHDEFEALLAGTPEF